MNWKEKRKRNFKRKTRIKFLRDFKKISFEKNKLGLPKNGSFFKQKRIFKRKSKRGG